MHPKGGDLISTEGELKKRPALLRPKKEEDYRYLRGPEHFIKLK